MAYTSRIQLAPDVANRNVRRFDTVVKAYIQEAGNGVRILIYHFFSNSGTWDNFKVEPIGQKIAEFCKF